MIDPQLITPDVIMDRLDAIPDDLRAAANDPKVMDIVALVCKDHHLNDEDRIMMVQQLTGCVILGILHDFDLGKEINSALELNNPQLANSIASDIGAKIFEPIKADLAKNYRPLIQTPMAPAPPQASAPPSVKPPVLNLSQKAQPPRPPVLDLSGDAPAAMRTALGIRQAPTAPDAAIAFGNLKPFVPTAPSTSSAVPKIAPMMPPAPHAAIPKPPVATPTTPGKLTAGIVLPPTPSPITRPTFTPPASNMGHPSAPTPPPAPHVPSPAGLPSQVSQSKPFDPAQGKPAPVMLHEQSEFKPLEKKTDVGRSMLGEKAPGAATSMFSTLSGSGGAPPVRARVNLGGVEEIKKPVLTSHTDITPPRTIHYTELKSALSTPFGAQSPAPMPQPQAARPPQPAPVQSNVPHPPMPVPPPSMTTPKPPTPPHAQ